MSFSVVTDILTHHKESNINCNSGHLTGKIIYYEKSNGFDFVILRYIKGSDETFINLGTRMFDGGGVGGEFKCVYVRE